MLGVDRVCWVHQKVLGTARHNIEFMLLYSGISCWVYIPIRGIYFGLNQKKNVS
jgi:hypothetical protein